MSNTLSKLMKQPDRGARLAENVLTRFFRDLLASKNVSRDNLMFLVELYLRNPANQIGMKGKTDDEKAVRVSNMKGNLVKEMEKSVFTFKVFMKLMEILKVEGLTITFSGRLANNEPFNLSYTDISEGGVRIEDISPQELKEVESFMNTVTSGRVSAPPIEGDFIELIDSK